MDDSFFEKFGSILKAVSQRAAIAEATPLAPLKEVEEQDGEQKTEGELQTVCRSTQDTDSGTETLLDTDSEPEDTEKVDILKEAVGWNVSTYYIYFCLFLIMVLCLGRGRLPESYISDKSILYLLFI